MAGDIVLEVDGLFKKFSRSYAGQRRILGNQLGSLLWGRPPAHRKIERGDFWALQDINFAVRRGQILGVIGFNGAGKSTLLRVLSGLMLPDIGKVTVRGTTGALIELGAGMQASLSGRDNIFLKGALLGKTPDEMQALYPKIAEFTELGDFIGAPLRTYSSGMRLRLGFSVAVHMRPDLLLLDEILAVGDYAFKQKCRGHINEMLRDAGVVFVSHSMDDIRQMCDSVIVLDRGKVIFHGSAKKAIGLYYQLAEKGRVIPGKGTPEAVSFHGELYDNPDRITDVSHCWGGPTGTPRESFDTWQAATHTTRFRLTQKPRRLVVGTTVWTQDGTKVTAIASDMAEVDPFDHSKLEHEVQLVLPQMSLNPGRYVSTTTIVDNGEALYRQLNAPFLVTAKKQHAGFFTPAHNWRSGDAVSSEDPVEDRVPPARLAVGGGE